MDIKHLNLGALHGVRVLDLSRVMAGPLAAQILADLGADVIKVERPVTGDDSRAWAPPFVSASGSAAIDESAYFWTCNRGKRSIAVDLSSEAGSAIVAQLAAKCDVVIENYKTGGLAKYGLDYDTLSQHNPGLVYCSVTGFGQTGPYSSRPGYDTVIQAIGGLMSITGNPDDAAGGGPRKVGIAVTDQMTALYSVIAIVSAIHERSSSGLGQSIDMSLLDVQVSALSNVGMNYLANGKVPQRHGNRMPTVYPSDAFRCRDGDIMVIVGNDDQFRRLCEALDIPQIACHEKFCRNASRLEHADELGPMLSKAIGAFTMDECRRLLDRAGVPASPINNVAQVFADPQVIERGMVRELGDVDGQAVKMISSPMRLSRTPPQYRRPPPRLGEHSEEVLQDVLGMTEAESADALRRGAVY